MKGGYMVLFLIQQVSSEQFVNVWPVVTSIILALISIIFSLLIYFINAKVRGVGNKVESIDLRLTECQKVRDDRIDVIETGHNELVKENDLEHKEILRQIYELCKDVAVIKTILEYKFPSAAQKAKERLNNGT